MNSRAIGTGMKAREVSDGVVAPVGWFFSPSNNICIFMLLWACFLPKVISQLG